MNEYELKREFAITRLADSTASEADVIDLWRREGGLSEGEADRRISELSFVGTDPGGTLGPDLRYKLRRAAFEAAYSGREAGDYLGAWRVLRLARRTWGDDGTLGRAASRLLPHWLLRQTVRRRGQAEAVIVK